MKQLQVKLSKTKEAQCLDKPEIKSKLNDIIAGYVEAFPPTKNEFYQENGQL